MVACLPHTRGSKLCLQMPSTTSAEVPWKRWRSHSRRSISDIRRHMYSFFLLERERQEVSEARTGSLWRPRSLRCLRRREAEHFLLRRRDRSLANGERGAASPR